MDQKTVEFALQVLDAQRGHLQGHEHSNRLAQAAYYDGMRRMFEIILTNGYTDCSYCLTITRDGHKIKSYT